VDINKAGDEPAVFVVGGLIGLAIGWSIENARKRADIKKLRAESVKLAGDHLKNVQTARRAYNDAVSKAGKCAFKLREILKSTATQEGTIDAAREDFCASVMVYAIPRYIDYAQWEHLDCKRDPKRINNVIKEVVLPELARFEDWIKVINSSNLLSYLGKNPARISKRTLLPLLTLTDGLSPVDEDKSRQDIEVSIEKLVSA